MERPGNEIADELRRIDLFTALDSNQLRIVIDSARVIRLDDGERLFDHGQPARQFFHLRSGQLKLFRSSPSGGEKIIEIVQPKDTFAQAVMFAAAEVQNYEAIALVHIVEPSGEVRALGRGTDSMILEHESHLAAFIAAT